MADVVIVGGGSVVLWTATQVKKRSPESDVQVYERHEEYQRSHVLKLEHFSMMLYAKKPWRQIRKRIHQGRDWKNARADFCLGNEKNGIMPVTLRFFVDKDTYDAIPLAQCGAW